MQDFVCPSNILILLLECTARSRSTFLVYHFGIGRVIRPTENPILVLDISRL